MVRVAIIGGSGYLGQFLVEDLGRAHDVAYTYNSNGPDSPSPSSYRVDLTTGEGLDALFAGFGEPGVVINCAAISQPMVCEERIELARAVNVPTRLVDCLRRSLDGRPLLVHVSTDHVYEGTSAFVGEEPVGDLRPVNAYGALKKEAEAFVVGSYANHAIFRSSIIYGEARPVERNLFLQWMDGALRDASQTIDFFRDEFRSPIFVEDIVSIFEAVVEGVGSGGRDFEPLREGGALVFNLGGPERLSRSDMARILCHHRGYDSTTSFGEADRPKTIKAPLDASMSIAKLEKAFDLKPKTFAQALGVIFPS